MKHFIRVIQTDLVNEPEIHEDKTDMKGFALNSVEVITIKNSLNSKMVAVNKKFQKHICDHDESNRQGCKLEDI